MRLASLTVLAALAATVLVAAAQAEYPALYRDQKLPELPGATIVSSGRQVTSLRDGLKIELQSAQGVQDILAFFREKMAPLGWKEISPRLPFKSVTAGTVRFQKDALTFDVGVTHFGGKSKVMLNLLQK